MSECKDEDTPSTACNPQALTSKTAALLATLALIPEYALTVFRERRVPDSDVDAEQLRRAREILIAVGVAITSARAGGPSVVERLWSALQEQPRAPREPVTPEIPVPKVLASPPGSLAPSAPPTPPGSLAPPAPPVPAPPPIALTAIGAAGRLESPWASKPPAPPVLRGTAGRPDAPLPGAAAPEGVAAARSSLVPSKPPAVTTTPGIDVAALNRIKLDESAPVTLGLEAPVAAGPVLPFRAAEDAQVAQPTTPPEELDDDETAGKTLDGEDVTALPVVLPFRGSEPSGAAEPPAAEAFDEPTVRMAPVALPAPPSVPGAVATPPPATPTARALPAPPPHLAAMTVEQYAALCAECAVHPTWMKGIHTQYEIQSAEQRTTLDRHWRERLARNDELMKLWQYHFGRYRRWFEQQG